MKNSNDLKREYKKDTGKNAPETYLFECVEVLETDKLDIDNHNDQQELIAHAEDFNEVINDNENLMHYLKWLEGKLCD